MNTSELTGAALDWAVARCEGLLCFGYRTDGKRFAVEDSDGQVEGFMPATDWAQGGPIIEREGISLTSYLDEEDPYWIGSVECRYKDFNATAYYEEYGPTPLIAAMRCYVVSKLGDTIDIPDELLINP
jgi:hypothetical protein